MRVVRLLALDFFHGIRAGHLRTLGPDDRPVVNMRGVAVAVLRKELAVDLDADTIGFFGDGDIGKGRCAKGEEDGEAFHGMERQTWRAAAEGARAFNGYRGRLR